MLKSKTEQINHLLVVEDKLGKRIIALEATTCSIGRDSTNSIVLYSYLVSRQHAILWWVTLPETASYFRIIDGNLQGKPSKNGLIINGQRSFSHDLKHGDLIVFAGDVSARYYATANLSDVNFLKSGAAKQVSGFLSNLSSPFKTLVLSDSKLKNSSETALVRLASFPEINSNPIIEIDRSGNITYLNPAAVSHFPGIKEVKLQHPILAGIILIVHERQEKCFVREVEIADKVFEQTIHYMAASDSIRSYIVDVTERKRTETVLYETERKFRAIFDQTFQFSGLLKPDGTLLEANQTALDFGGIQHSDVINRPFWETRWWSISPETQNRLQAAIALAAAGEKVRYEVDILGAGNTVATIDFSLKPVKDEAGQVILLILEGRNISDRKQVEALLQEAYAQLELRVEKRTAELLQANQQLQSEIVEWRKVEEEVSFLQTIMQAITESADFHSALGVALSKVCDFTGWKFGEVWIPTGDRTMLECSSTWYGSSQNLEKFRQLSKKFTFPPGVGLPGRVWSSKSPEWIQDVSSEPETFFLRKQYAIEIGFKAGLGIPIIGNNEVLAVLVFFMFEACEEEKRLIEIVSAVATQLGSLIQRKWAEEALRESEERFRLLVEGVKDYAIFMLDLDGKIVSWNTGAERIKGYRAEEILGMHFSCFYPEEDIALGNPEQVLHLCQVNGQIEQEGWRVRKDGSRFWVNVVITALRDRSGKLCGFSEVTRDITERKRTEDALRSSVATNHALLNAIPDLMFRITREGIFVNFKAAKNNNLLMPRSEFLGKHLYEVFPTEVAQPTMNCIERALSTGEVQILECQMLENNNQLDYEVRIAVSAENEVMAIIRDITERKRAEAEIRNALEKEKELSELKSRFVSMTSHEFRTPLATILSSAELLEHYSHKWSEDKKLNHLQRIQASVKHMTGLLNDVLLLGKAEAGKLEFNPLPLNLVEFCGDLVEEIQLTTNSHAIVFRPHNQCITASIDEKLLRHILTNLLSNAIKYSPQGGTVYFDLVCEQGDAIFRIQDQGIGIPIADQAQLFNSFNRASNVGTISGTGLGLAIVKKSVNIHGGDIIFNSKIGVGTTFIVKLPSCKKSSFQIQPEN